MTHLRHLLPEIPAFLNDDQLVLVGDEHAQRRIGLGVDLPWIVTPSIGDGFLARLRWETFSLPGLLDRHGVDVLFHPGNFAVFRSPVPQVLLVHNLAPFMPWVIEHESWRQKVRLSFLRALTRRSLSVAHSVVFISEWGRSLVLGGEEADSQRMPVVPFGAEHGGNARSEGLLKGLDLRRDEFVLTVSHLYRYKNVEKLIDAYAHLGENVSHWPLVVVGEPYDSGYAAYLEELAGNCAAPVIFTGGLDAPSLLSLMQACRTFVFTSEAENLPITLLESMSAGAPIITNRSCSMPETCEDAAIYVDEMTSSGYRRALNEVLFDSVLRSHLRSASREQARRFRWDAAAEQTLAVLRRANQR